MLTGTVVSERNAIARRGKMRIDSIHATAEVVLREHGRPQSVGPLAEEVSAKLGRTVTRGTLVSVLARMVARQEVFVRAQGAVYGLREWSEE